MTVKCIPASMQEDICFNFTNKTYGINAMAEMTNSSRRTIIRVLENAGIDPGVKHRKPKQPQMTVARAASILAPEPVADFSDTLPMAQDMCGYLVPGQVITPVSRPWYRRVFDAVVGVSNTNLLRF